MYEVLLSPAARTSYAAADRPLAQKLARCFAQLEREPRRHNNVKRLSGQLAGRLRYKVGDWRVIFRIDDRARKVLVLLIAHEARSMNDQQPAWGVLAGLTGPESNRMRRSTRKRKLTSAQGRRYQGLRRRVSAELPELLRRHNERLAVHATLSDLLAQLKAARQAKGLSLADITELTGMDRSALSKLENGGRPNPTVDTLVRYAEVVGKRLTLALSD